MIVRMKSSGLSHPTFCETRIKFSARKLREVSQKGDAHFKVTTYKEYNEYQE